MNKQRKECEELVYTVMDKLDPTGKNKEYWMGEFAEMDDKQFEKYITKSPFPFFFQTGVFDGEATMSDVKYVLDKILKVPLLESVYMPYKFKDSNGKAIKTKPCIVVYITDKKMKQFVTKKNNVIIDNSVRDMKTGQLTGVSKQARISDHEQESFNLSGLTAVSKEFNNPRGDDMVAKEEMINKIKVLGQVSLDELDTNPDNSLARNNMTAAFIGAQLFQNTVMDENDYMTPYTKSLKSKRTERVD